MTEFQAEQIENLRKQGVGYRSIGTIVGLSRDTVRNYCKSKGLDGYASDITVNIQEQMVLRKADCTDTHREAEKILLRQMQAGMVGGASGSRKS